MFGIRVKILASCVSVTHHWFFFWQTPNRRWSNGAYESFDILKVASLDVDIPEDPIYDPTLTIQVR